MINKVTLIGHLGGDPEVKHLESGVMVARFSLATNENYLDKNGVQQKLTEWHNVVVWRDLAERAEKFLKKGMLCYVEGKISYRKYQDKDGVEKTSTDIVANNFRLLEKREGGGTYETARFPSEDHAPPARGGNSSATTAQSAPPAAMSPAPTNAPAEQAVAVPAEGDDLPF